MARHTGQHKTGGSTASDPHERDAHGKDAHGKRVPLLAESLHVSKRQVESGRVRVSKQVESRRVQFDPPLLRETIDIRRVAIGRPVEAPAPIRQEGDVLIIPVHEQVVVTQWMLTEEVHVRIRRSEFRAPRETTLLRERLSVERDECDSPSTC